MIQIVFVGDIETALYASKRGCVLFGFSEETAEAVEKAGGIFVNVGIDPKKGIRVEVPSFEHALILAVDSCDGVLIAEEGWEILESMAKRRGKPVVRGSGKESVEELLEKIVRKNMFGSTKAPFSVREQSL